MLYDRELFDRFDRFDRFDLKRDEFDRFRPIVPPPWYFDPPPAPPPFQLQRPLPSCNYGGEPIPD